MNDGLYEKVDQYQKSNLYLSELLQMFDPIISHYSFLLDREDDREDFQIFLIEVFHKIPLYAFEQENVDWYILSYIKKSMQNKYVQLSKRKQLDQMQFIWCAEIHMSKTEPVDGMADLLKTAIHELTSKQKNVILLEFYEGYSEVEIAIAMEISRQAVNRIKQRAIRNLKTFIKQSNDV